MISGTLKSLWAQTAYRVDSTEGIQDISACGTRAKIVAAQRKINTPIARFYKILTIHCTRTIEKVTDDVAEAFLARGFVTRIELKGGLPSTSYYKV